MAVRPMIRIDEELCNGCGECVVACAEGALQIIDGKARVVNEVFCDGLGACIGECPTGALVIEEREAPGFDEKAVEKHLAGMKAKEKAFEHEHAEKPLACGCPGSMARSIDRSSSRHGESIEQTGPVISQLTNWPVQIHLIPVKAPYLDNAKLLIAADCVPFAMADFHRRYIKDHVVLVGCPKLDDADAYMKKLSAIFKENDIREITVTYMEVPCCFGLVHLVKQAVADSGKDIETIYTKIGIDGEIRETVAA